MAKELYGIDRKENFIKHLDGALLSFLLKDRSSGKNLIWATDTYMRFGAGFGPQDRITQKRITGKRGCMILPRVEKTGQDRIRRIKNKAEVFTPSWLCNKQNNLVDSAWFGRENVFNTETEKGWRTNSDTVVFPDDKTWQAYVKENRIEFTCGEAPYLTSRYDAVTGEPIALPDRIGLLDRKLRVVSENTSDRKEWHAWAVAAFRSVYGFDFYGDNVLIARENLLSAYAEAYAAKFDASPTSESLLDIAKILAWNIWQMDGLKFVVPYSCRSQEEESIPCPGCEKNDDAKHTGIYCKIMNWQTKRSERFIDQIRKNG